MKILNSIQNKIDIHIRKFCNCLIPKQKMVITAILFVMFFLASICVIVFAAYQVGKEDGKLLNVEHIHPTPYLKSNYQDNE